MSKTIHKAQIEAPRGAVPHVATPQREDIAWQSHAATKSAPDLSVFAKVADGQVSSKRKPKLNGHQKGSSGCELKNDNRVELWGRSRAHAPTGMGRCPLVKSGMKGSNGGQLQERRRGYISNNEIEEHQWDAMLTGDQAAAKREPHIRAKTTQSHGGSPYTSRCASPRRG